MDVQGGAKSGRIAPAPMAVVGAVGVVTTAGCAVGAGGQPAPIVQAPRWRSYRAPVRTSGHPGHVFAAQTPFAGCARTAAKDQIDYAVAYDAVSGRWSDEVWPCVGSASL